MCTGRSDGGYVVRPKVGSWPGAAPHILEGNGSYRFIAAGAVQNPNGS
jgi:hypothetical protein